jgi:polysaccharide export outer membrane protein
MCSFEPLRVSRAIAAVAVGLWIALGTSLSAQTPPAPAAAAPVAAPTAAPQNPSFLPREPAAQTSAAAPQSVNAPSGYVLAAGDVIAVEVFGEEDLRSSARVGADGTVSVPLLGPVRVGGLSLAQASARLTELYGRDYLVNPKLNVALVGFAKQRFTVLGQVNRPGSFEMPEGAGGIDILEAVAIAGGYTRIAAPDKISIRRRTSRGDEVIRVNAKRLAKQGGGFRVQSGDTITVGESIF